MPNLRTYLATTAAAAVLAVPFASASAQEANAIADRVIALLGSEGVVDAAYESAEGSDVVTVQGVTGKTKEGPGADTFRAATVEIASPALVDPDGLTAETITISGVEIMSTNWGEATIGSAVGQTFAMTGEETSTEGEPTDNSASAVRSGRIEDITVDPSSSEPFTIETVSFEQGDLVDGIATERSIDADGIVLSRGDFGASSDEFFDITGVDEVTVDLSGSAEYDPRENVMRLNDVVLSGENVGEITMSLALGNVSSDTIDQLEENPIAALSPVTIIGMSLTIENGELVETAAENRAEQLGVSVEDWQTGNVVNLRRVMTIFAGTPFAAQATPALESYLKGETDSVTVSMSPSAPVPVAGLLLASQASPRSIPQLTNLQVTSQ